MHNTSTVIPRPIPVRKGSSFGFLFIFAGFSLCIVVGGAVVGSERDNARSALLGTPGIAWIDGTADDGNGSPFTRIHLAVPDANATFANVATPCVFAHGDTVRLISEHDGLLHASNGRCSGWVPMGWLSATPAPASGLLR